MHFATSLKGRFAGNRGKQSQSVWWKGTGSQKPVSCNAYVENQGGHFVHFL